MLVGTQIQKEALELWGEDKQANMITEECLELATALLKYQRNPCDQTREAVIDEIADVFVVIEYGPMIFNASEIQNRINFKLYRLRDRIKAESFEDIERKKIQKDFRL